MLGQREFEFKKKIIFYNLSNRREFSFLENIELFSYLKYFSDNLKECLQLCTKYYVSSANIDILNSFASNCVLEDSKAL